MTPPDTGTSTPMPPGIAPPPARRWLQVALALSLALNLAILGVVVGTMLRNGGPMHGGMANRDVGFGPFTEALSPQDRAELRQAFWAKAPEWRDARRAMRNDFKDLLDQLRAVPLDVTGLQQVFDRQNTRNAERQKLGQALIYNLIINMSDDARIAFANRLEQSLAHRPKPPSASNKP